MDIPVSRVSVLMTPERDRERHSAITFLCLAFVAIVSTMWIYMAVLKGSITTKGWMSIATCLNVLAGMDCDMCCIL